MQRLTISCFLIFISYMPKLIAQEFEVLCVSGKHPSLALNIICDPSSSHGLRLKLQDLQHRGLDRIEEVRKVATTSLVLENRRRKFNQSIIELASDTLHVSKNIYPDMPDSYWGFEIWLRVLGEEKSIKMICDKSWGIEDDCN